MGGNKGYPWEKEVEEALMSVRDQKRSDSMTKRTRRQPGSGNQEYALGDVVTNFDFLDEFGQLCVECKDRKNARGDGKSVSIAKGELDKIRDEAESQLMVPVFAFKVKQPHGGVRTPLYPGDARNPMNTKWLAMPISDFVRLLEYTRDLYDAVSGCGAAVGSGGRARTQDAGCRVCRREFDRLADRMREVFGM